ncbi:MAG: hypothetical protein ACRD0O_22180, partial [Acidimicrobiia bacterium]
VDVSWMARGESPRVPHMAPCLFRRCIACAHHRRAAGQTVALWGIPAGVDPVVEVLIAPGDRKLPSGIYQVRVEGGWRVVFPCLLPADRCAEALAGPETLAGDWPQLDFHSDPLTGVTLVFCRRTDEEGPLAGPQAEQLVDAQARLLVAELLDGLTPAARSGTDHG